MFFYMYLVGVKMGKGVKFMMNEILGRFVNCF